MLNGGIAATTAQKETCFVYSRSNTFGALLILLFPSIRSAIGTQLYGCVWLSVRHVAVWVWVGVCVCVCAWLNMLPLCCCCCYKLTFHINFVRIDNEMEWKKKCEIFVRSTDLEYLHIYDSGAIPSHFVDSRGIGIRYTPFMDERQTMANMPIHAKILWSVVSCCVSHIHRSIHRMDIVRQEKCEFNFVS